MKNRYSVEEAAKFLQHFGGAYEEDLLLRTYTSRLLGSESTLVLFGGGNTSIKGTGKNCFGEEVDTLFIKASGFDLKDMLPEHHVAVEMQPLQKLVERCNFEDLEMMHWLKSFQLQSGSPAPSIEAPVHAVVPARFVDHTHPDAILTLTNRPNGHEVVRMALGDDILIVDYCKAGMELSKRVAEAIRGNLSAPGMVWMQHGLMTWGETAEESYGKMIALVDKAEKYIEAEAGPLSPLRLSYMPKAIKRWREVAPLLRGALNRSRRRTQDRQGDAAPKWILHPRIADDVLEFFDAPDAKHLATAGPLTPDHLIRTKAIPLWVPPLDNKSDADVRDLFDRLIGQYVQDYEEYFSRHKHRLEADPPMFPPQPLVVLLSGIGAVGIGLSSQEARTASQIASQTIVAKSKLANAGGHFQSLSEIQLFDMEYRPQQLEKLKRLVHAPLSGKIALVTGAAGAIGSAICAKLLEEGCHVAANDLDNDPLHQLVAELKQVHKDRILATPFDLTKPEEVAGAYQKLAAHWGGLDILVANAGVAHVASLEKMSMEDFQRVHKVNVEGTLLAVQNCAQLFRRQHSGGDVVLISTKNVFAPGAQFGAYSASKAAAHQLARVASLELADMDVRVNMVAPDAVFHSGERASGLWAEVGPSRMKARGLSAAQLEDYYQARNLLKERIQAKHVARAVYFFVSRQTPTTGATLPVDGGLPDATPR